METLAIIVFLVVTLGTFVGLWVKERKLVTDIAHKNVQLNQQVNKQDDLLKHKNYRIKQLFLQQVDKADRTELVSIFHRLLDDKGSPPPRRVSEGSKSPAAK